jgi:GNAT superfamily N-acetyltransferase
LHKFLRMEIFIRQMSKDDAQYITTLTYQLGYPLSFEQILENISAVMENKDHDAFVAVYENRVIGWIGVAQAFQIESLPFCEIRGLVIDDQYRNLGIGKMLVEKAKQWGKEKGNDKLRLRCNVKRTETHLFYQHLGFTETKQQKVFEIEI